MEIEDVDAFNVVEVSFKNGARKAFFYNQPFTRAATGDIVVVDTQAGCDVGRISLSGELVRLQMRKKRIPEDGFFPKVIRKANERDLEKLDEVRSAEMPAMVRARAISRTLGLNMKIGDVEFQGDGKKITFYYTADGRVDFRELIRHFAKEFKVKIEMRQIGARQESARIGGIGPCGRELCCSTWLTSYRTVSTAAARYQNLAINQAKLSGQCGRLKCCLNYELDTYMEALSNFPEDADKLKTKNGVAVLVKTDIFKGLMYYGYEHDHGRGRMFALDLERVRSVRQMNRRGEFPEELELLQIPQETGIIKEPDFGAGDVTDVIELPPDERRRRKKNRNRERGGRDEQKPRNPRPENQGGRTEGPSERKEGGRGNERRPNQRQEPNKPAQPKTPQDQAPGQPTGEKKEGARNRGRGRGRGKGRRNPGDGNKDKGDK